MSSIRIQCSACGKQASVRPETSGKKVKCPACTAVIAVPPSAPSTSRETQPRKPKSKATPYWKFRWGDFTDVKKKDAFIAFADDAFWTMPMEGKAAKAAASDLDAGVHPSEALASGASMVPYADITEVRFDENRTNLIVDCEQGGGLISHDFAFHEAETREQVFDEFDRRLPDWGRSRKQFTAIQAAVVPLTVMLVMAFFTALAVALAFVVRDWQEENNFVGMIRLLGPLGWGSLAAC